MKTHFVHNGTIRQRIIQLLCLEHLDVIGLARALQLREKEITEHLPHVAKSVVVKGGRFKVDPAQCQNCGFEFKNRHRLSPPGRCPRCKQSRIAAPEYHITGLLNNGDH
jgi:predicted Zn-ribbon and HTH transcriptional regulator